MIWPFLFRNSEMAQSDHPQLVKQDVKDNGRESGLFQECSHLRVDYHHRILFQVLEQKT